MCRCASSLKKKVGNKGKDIFIMKDVRPTKRLPALNSERFIFRKRQTKNDIEKKRQQAKRI